MDVITVNVGQGALSVVRHNAEAIVIDARIPPSGDETVAYVKGMLATYLKGYYVRGLILTSFDKDHADISGVSLILLKYRPDWVMYPKYYKDTEEAGLIFRLIDEQEKARKVTTNPLKRYSVRLDQLSSRLLTGLSLQFQFELFSPHIEDMDNSNNSSIVLKLTGQGQGGFSYLITGDTENERWNTIDRLFGASLRSDVMAAPHHGSKTGVNPATLLHVEPNTVLISAGVDNQYGHPDPQAVKVYRRIAKHVFSTSHVQGGVSFLTVARPDDFETRFIST